MRSVYLIIFLLFLLGPAWTARLSPNVYEGGRSRNVRDREIRNSSMAARLLGELRASTGDMLFIKTERYLHYGVAYEPHLDKVIMSISAETQAIDDTQAAAHDHDHAHEHDEADEEPMVTIIRTVDRDFRGFIGELERRIQPWSDPNEPHRHTTDGTELLPWYRVMTLADPNNIRAYAIGSWWLKRHSLDEAIAFVEEGLRKNPRAFQLHHTYGALLYEKGREERARLDNPEDMTPKVRELFDRALMAFIRSVELGLERRPAGWTPEMENESDEWTVYEDDDLRGAARFAMLLERNFGDKRRALALAREYARRLGGDGILERQIPNLEKQLQSGEEEPFDPVKWTQLVRTLDVLAEEADAHSDNLGEAGTRTLAVRLKAAAEAVAEAAAPMDAAHPARLELAQMELAQAAERLAQADQWPLERLRQELGGVHRIVAELLTAAGMAHMHDHSHDDDHDHDADHDRLSQEHH